MFNRSKLLAVGLLLAAFVAGAAVGVAAMALWSQGDREHRGGRPREEISYLDRLDRELRLRPAQRESVSAILRRYDQPMQELWRGTRARLDSMRLQVRGEIAAMLDPDQRERFRLMNQRMDSLRMQREQRERGGVARERR